MWTESNLYRRNTDGVESNQATAIKPIKPRTAPTPKKSTFFPATAAPDLALALALRLPLALLELAEPEALVVARTDAEADEGAVDEVDESLDEEVDADDDADEEAADETAEVSPLMARWRKAAAVWSPVCGALTALLRGAEHQKRQV
jgi:hypothetical protein